MGTVTEKVKAPIGRIVNDWQSLVSDTELPEDNLTDKQYLQRQASVIKDCLATIRQAHRTDRNCQWEIGSALNKVKDFHQYGSIGKEIGKWLDAVGIKLEIRQANRYARISEGLSKALNEHLDLTLIERESLCSHVKEIKELEQDLSDGVEIDCQKVRTFLENAKPKAQSAEPSSKASAGEPVAKPAEPAQEPSSKASAGEPVAKPAEPAKVSSKASAGEPVAKPAEPQEQAQEPAQLEYKRCSYMVNGQEPLFLLLTFAEGLKSEIRDHDELCKLAKCINTILESRKV